MENVNAFMQIGIVGIALSFIVEAIKNKFGTNSMTTKGLTLGLAIVLGALVFFFSGTAIWITILGVLGAASAFYAFFLK